MNKEDVRKHYLRLRNELSDSEYTQLSDHICTIFFSRIDLVSIRTLHTFLPIISKKEPNTWFIVDRITKEFSSIQISVPKMNTDGTLMNFNFVGREQIKDNKWRIPEPQFGEVTPSIKIDLVIVPLVGFDSVRNRVGYGKGFYDRFLKECRQDCKKVGLSFFDPVDEISDIDRFDVKLDAVITPTKVF